MTSGKILDSSLKTRFKTGPMAYWILAGFFMLASNIALEKWLLERFDFLEVAWVTAVVIMSMAALEERIKNGSFSNLTPLKWKPLLLISLCTLGAWNAFLYALIGLSIFEFGALGLLAPLVMAMLAMLFLHEKPPELFLLAILLGLLGGAFLTKGEWQGLGHWHYHLVMVFAMICGSLRWVLVKRFGRDIPTVAVIFWEPLLVLTGTFFLIDLWSLLNRFHPGLFFAALLLFLSRQCLVRSYQSQETKAISIASLIYTKLIWLSFFGYWFWGIVPSLQDWCGLLLIVCGSWLIIRNPQYTS